MLISSFPSLPAKIHQQLFSAMNELKLLLWLSLTYFSPCTPGAKHHPWSAASVMFKLWHNGAFMKPRKRADVVELSRILSVSSGLIKMDLFTAQTGWHPVPRVRQLVRPGGVLHRRQPSLPGQRLPAWWTRLPQRRRLLLQRHLSDSRATMHHPVGSR